MTFQEMTMLPSSSRIHKLQKHMLVGPLGGANPYHHPTCSAKQVSI